MARPRCCRRIAHTPYCALFKPANIPMSVLEEVVLSLDELEAIRLADRDGLYQEAAAERMNVSRATFGRTLESAHRKVASALIEGKALRIEGGVVEMDEVREFACSECGHKWGSPFGGGRPKECPGCNGARFHRVPGNSGTGDLGREGKRLRCRRRSHAD